jgi:hypothetical protein
MVYYCWVAMMLPDYANDIVAGMVRKGYSVCPATENEQLVHSKKGGGPANLLIIKVDSREKGTAKDSAKVSAKTVGRDFSNVLANVKAKYYTAIVTEAGDGWFEVTNIELPEASPSPTKPIESVP